MSDYYEKMQAAGKKPGPPAPALPDRDSLRMTLSYVKKNAKPAITLRSDTLLHFGEVGAFVGLPGTGKSAVMEAITATALGVPSFGFSFNSTGKKVLVIDTERTPDDVSNSYQNIYKRLGATPDQDLERLVYLALSEFAEPQDLKAIVERELSGNEFELVILDGILDFGLSLLDDKDSAAVIRWARAVAVRHNVAVIVTMHPNKGTDQLAGHLGGFIYRWTRSILFIRSVQGNKSIKEITGDPPQSKLSHGDVHSLEPVYFTWDARYGMLTPCNYSPKENAAKTDNIEKCLSVILADSKRMGFNELKRKIHEASGKSEATAARWIKTATDSGIITNTSGLYSLSNEAPF